MTVLAALGLALALASCTSAGTSSTSTASPAVEATSAGPATAPHCGVERWPVKTGTDPGAKSIDLTHVTDTSIAELASAPPPSAMPADRDGPVETTVYRIHGILVKYKQEADSDYHLVVTDGGQTIVAEIPAPACVGDGSPFAAAITHARKQFDAVFAPGDFWQPAGVPVIVTGVGFYDPEHGQTGGLVLQGGQWTAEIHPVTDIQIGSPASPTSTPSPSTG